MKSELGPLPIFLYDSECTLCNRFKMALEKLPGSDQLTMVSIHQKEVYAVFDSLDEERCHEIMHVIDDSGAILQGSDALSYLLKFFPGVAKFAWLIESGMGKKAIDFFYQKATEYRVSLLNGCPGCKKNTRKKSRKSSKNSSRIRSL